MEIKITRKQKLLSVRNDMVSTDYYLIHGRIINDEKTHFYRFKFVIYIDLCNDLWDGENDIPYDEALNDIIWAFCDMVGDDFNNKYRLSAFCDSCNRTIERWNKRFA